MLEILEIALRSFLPLLKGGQLFGLISLLLGAIGMGSFFSRGIKDISKKMDDINKTMLQLREDYIKIKEEKANENKVFDKTLNILDKRVGSLEVASDNYANKINQLQKEMQNLTEEKWKKKR